MDCIVRQAPLSMEFSMQEYWSELPFPSPDLPNPGIKPRSPALQVDSYHLSHQGRPRILEWVTYPFSRGSSWSGNWTTVSCLAGGFFPNWATREALTSSKFRFPQGWVVLLADCTMYHSVSQWSARKFCHKFLEYTVSPKYCRALSVKTTQLNKAYGENKGYAWAG